MKNLRNVFSYCFTVLCLNCLKIIVFWSDNLQNCSVFDQEFTQLKSALYFFERYQKTDSSGIYRLSAS